MEFPQDFINRMQNLLPADYEDFFRSYTIPRTYGLRLNTLKIDAEEFEKAAPFGSLAHVPWSAAGFYYGDEVRPGKHPWHEAGLYYIQEPSAMLVGELLDPKPGERILDLCAAPGGKTTHLASKMQGKGLLVSNEIHPSRAKILSQNVERMGIANAVVCNEDSSVLAKRFPNFFDRIVVDAPCSGEGMFRKDVNALKEWSLYGVEKCAARQLMILGNAADMLKPGGRLVYSTCTFSPEENEGVISRFLKVHGDFMIEEGIRVKGADTGRPDWVENPVAGLENTIRLWPHKIDGEGHFAAVLRKKEGGTAVKVNPVKGIKDRTVLGYYREFEKKFLCTKKEGPFILYGEQLYLAPEQMTDLSQLKILRPGLHMGTIKKNRFEPSHALALSLKAVQAACHIGLSHRDAGAFAYLRGETLAAASDPGWNLVLVDGYPLGWGKASKGVLKNHYPKGLRW